MSDTKQVKKTLDDAIKLVKIQKKLAEKAEEYKQKMQEFRQKELQRPLAMTRKEESERVDQKAEYTLNSALQEYYFEKSLELNSTYTFKVKLAIERITNGESDSLEFYEDLKKFVDENKKYLGYLAGTNRYIDIHSDFYID